MREQLQPIGEEAPERPAVLGMKFLRSVRSEAEGVLPSLKAIGRLAPALAGLYSKASFGISSMMLGNTVTEAIAIEAVMKMVGAASTKIRGWQEGGRNAGDN